MPVTKRERSTISSTTCFAERDRLTAAAGCRPAAVLCGEASTDNDHKALRLRCLRDAVRCPFGRAPARRLDRTQGGGAVEAVAGQAIGIYLGPQPDAPARRFLGLHGSGARFRARQPRY